MEHGGSVGNGRFSPRRPIEGAWDLAMTSARSKRPREVRDMWRAFSQEAVAGDGMTTAHHIATDHVVFGRTRGNQEGKGVEVSMSSYSAELSHAARTGARIPGGPERPTEHFFSAQPQTTPDVVERPGSLLHAEVLRRELEAARHRIAVLERSNKHLQADKEFLQSVLSKGGEPLTSQSRPRWKSTKSRSLRSADVAHYLSQ
ncbi:coiled-coil domain-containing protein 106 isoform X1 [Petromyzon marinus]|uniref:coiled-coil domain-containing protein 106 isoform X1 n=1 Tax=Petromyzon marinus TaxID=7757 RepID=UPI003F6FE124